VECSRSQTCDEKNEYPILSNPVSEHFASGLYSCLFITVLANLDGLLMLSVITSCHSRQRETQQKLKISWWVWCHTKNAWFN